MVIDEESLILIDIPENNHWETIDDVYLWSIVYYFKNLELHA